jgi:hypothetical protein
VDGHDGIGAIVLPAEDALGLGRIDLEIEPIEPGVEVRADVLTGPHPLDEDVQVFFLFLERLDQIDLVLQPPPALQDALGFRLILPEVGLANSCLELVGLIARASCLKDTSATRRIVLRGPRVDGPDLPIRMPQPCLLSRPDRHQTGVRDRA